MRAFLDACVLFPPVMREALICVAEEGGFAPQWSPRVLEEWRRTSERQSQAEAVLVTGEIARLNGKWSDATIQDAPPRPELWLPDPDDIHVLQSALAGKAEVIVTMNLRDFPKRELDPHGISAVHPDAFLMDILGEEPDLVQRAMNRLQSSANEIAGRPVDLPALLKKTRLPRLAKYLRNLGSAYS